MPLSSSLIASSSRIRFVRKKEYDSKFYYDLYTKVPTTASAGTFKAGENVTYNIDRKIMVKTIAKSEWYGGLLSSADFSKIRNDVDSKLTN